MNIKNYIKSKSALSAIAGAAQKCNPRIVSACAMVLATFAGANAARAQSIGIDWSGVPTDVDAYSAGTPIGTNTAGVVPQSNWNDVTTDSGSVDGAITFFNDSTGAPVNGLGVAWTGGTHYNYSGYNAYYNVVPFSSVTDPNSVGDSDLISNFAYANAGASLTLTGIPYASYDVYVYLGGNAAYPAAYNGALIINLNGGAETASVQGETLANGSNWVQADNYTPVTPGDYSTYGAAANYAAFDNLSGGDLTVGCSGNDGWYEGITGIQIVNTAAVPEPETYATALCGFGMLLGLQKFRNRRA